MNDITEFLSKLLMRSLTLDEEIRLSSAQRARFQSWLSSKSVVISNDRLRTPFTIKSLTLIPTDGFRYLRNQSQSNGLEIRRMGVGTDIQLISELFPESVLPSMSELSELFTKYEIKYSMNSPIPMETFAGIFSLKESLIKAGVKLDSFTQIEITHNSMGAPIYYGYAVSVSHSAGLVVSIAITRQ
jgi:phosphopantetheine--protein transferase-like protein